ncbi:hypothetical protein DFH11DRAFT_1877094 [Phellopilus nigrolimitatus]|nr:hypothetical protein DFH11DRAFT_1877090 [Phellopilus nigrolimitatus]KAH8115330.1 hypothetical protein DFH11DRAFT_1877092 [Phellopilus nigrolimitatus]KAH8115333.1 hypothetical protein DFH11DRAFT_1877094 [Phellopilus nigrolimitatus]
MPRLPCAPSRSSTSTCKELGLDHCADHATQVSGTAWPQNRSAETYLSRIVFTTPSSPSRPPPSPSTPQAAQEAGRPRVRHLPLWRGRGPARAHARRRRLLLPSQPRPRALARAAHRAQRPFVLLRRLPSRRPARPFVQPPCARCKSTDAALAAAVRRARIRQEQGPRWKRREGGRRCAEGTFSYPLLCPCVPRAAAQQRARAMSIARAPYLVRADRPVELRDASVSQTLAQLFFCSSIVLNKHS